MEAAESSAHFRLFLPLAMSTVVLALVERCALDEADALLEGYGLATASPLATSTANPFLAARTRLHLGTGSVGRGGGRHHDLARAPARPRRAQRCRRELDHQPGVAVACRGCARYGARSPSTSWPSHAAGALFTRAGRSRPTCATPTRSSRSAPATRCGRRSTANREPGRQMSARSPRTDGIPTHRQVQPNLCLGCRPEDTRHRWRDLPRSTIEYYRSIVEVHRDRSNRPPRVLINSIDGDERLGHLAADRQTDLVSTLLQALQQLAAGGAELALLASISVHIAFDDVRATSPLSADRHRRVNRGRDRRLQAARLFATRFTMQADLFGPALAPCGISVVMLRDDEEVDGILLGGPELSLLLPIGSPRRPRIHRHRAPPRGGSCDGYALLRRRS